MTLNKHPLSRLERLVNEEQKEKGRLTKEAAEVRSNRVRKRQLREALKSKETKDELDRARHGDINLPL